MLTISAWLPTYKQSTAGSGWAGWSAAPPESPPESSADVSAKYNSNSASWVWYRLLLMRLVANHCHA
tara:strand:+ start:1316 stop:1516 length:201 start_codon:yes stop_codon:yes gene_type:complete